MTYPDSEAAPTQRPGLFARLRRDARGNTLAIVGAALVPLVAMIGSGVDLSRAYMAKTRLQSACDAASLAGRRVMTNDTMSTDVRDEATKFFNFNFKPGLYGTAPFTPAVTRPTSGVIKVAASTTIPTVIMDMFGFDTLPLSVECDASQNFVNTDIVLVLDVTGSMDQDINGKNTSTVANRKITALREAVMALYDELAPIQAELESNGMRLRYGIVPYSSTVNVGALLMAESRNYVLGGNSGETWTFQTRSNTARTDTWNSRYADYCRYFEDASWNSTYSRCTYYPQAQRTVNIHDYVRTLQSGGTYNAANIVGGARKDVRWSGCIEERQTVSTIKDGPDYTIPAGAHDLNINLIPSSAATKWKPLLPDISYSPLYVGSSRMALPSSAACPTPARRLQTWTRSSISSYVNSLSPVGGTYHDIGMIWGARLISAAGVFGDSPDTFNGMDVNKHIIFLTDGKLEPNASSYSAYGIENADQRITGTWVDSADQTARHRQRFKMACNAARGMNVTIWVVAFATGADGTLVECAGSQSYVSTSTNRQQLIDKFTEIGKNIGALRLTQ